VEVTLVAVKQDGQQRAVPMRRARLAIGRKKECDVRIPAPSVSREHCELRVESGKLWVKDLGSANGTYVNGERIQEVEAQAGAVLAVGPAVFVLRIDGAPENIDAKAIAASVARPSAVASPKAPGVRPAAPGPAKPKPALDDSDLDDLGSSAGDFDFDFLDDEDEPKL
jgi:predicted component of type VI protein secretion system